MKIEKVKQAIRAWVATLASLIGNQKVSEFLSALSEEYGE